MFRSTLLYLGIFTLFVSIFSLLNILFCYYFDSSLNIKKIYFDLEKNLDEKKYYISNISINSLKDNLNSQNSQIYFESEITNIQTLTKLINEYFRKINLG